MYRLGAGLIGRERGDATGAKISAREPRRRGIFGLPGEGSARSGACRPRPRSRQNDQRRDSGGRAGGASLEAEEMTARQPRRGRSTLLASAGLTALLIATSGAAAPLDA